MPKGLTKVPRGGSENLRERLALGFAQEEPSPKKPGRGRRKPVYVFEDESAGL
jgi:hypothetical protein